MLTGVYALRPRRAPRKGARVLRALPLLFVARVASAHPGHGPHVHSWEALAWGAVLTLALWGTAWAVESALKLRRERV